jgi:hypothetical protein
MIGLKKRRAGYYLKIGGGVCGIRRGKLATKKSRNIIGDTFDGRFSIFIPILNLKDPTVLTL